MAGLRIDGGFCILVIAKRALGLVAKISVFQIDESFGSDKIGSNRAPIFFIVGRVGDIGPWGTVYSADFLPLGGLLESGLPAKVCGNKAVPTAVAPKDWMKCLRFTPER